MNTYRKEHYENKLQMDYFSKDYFRFVEDFQKYSSMNIPLTFLIDEILRTMAINQKNFFVLNKEKTKDGRDHYFWFEIKMLNNYPIRFFRYLNSSLYNNNRQKL